MDEFNKLLESVKNRRTCKKYMDKLIPIEVLNKLFEFINTSPTSMGLEHWRVIDFREEKKNIVKEYTNHNVPKIEKASDVLFFVSKGESYIEKDNEWLEERINAVTSVSSKLLGADQEEMNKSYKQYIKNSGVKQSGHTTLEWSLRQAYIALGFALIGAKALGLDSTPIEGFDYLKLEEHLRNQNIIDEGEYLACGIIVGYANKEEKPYIGDKQIRANIKEKFKLI